jgi:hypothetical protein
MRASSPDASELPRLSDRQSQQRCGQVKAICRIARWIDRTVHYYVIGLATSNYWSITVMDKERDFVTIELEPESDLARALAAVDETHIALVSGGRRYLLRRDPFGSAADHDPGAFLKALHAVVGTLTPEEGERLKRGIYRWREEGSRPIQRP